MSLPAGTRLGPYEVGAPIGKGGMGDVYRARDTKLGREVAVKVLPEPFAEDEERMARFQREARVLASLNHPNIAAVYGLEESEGAHFLVMELVPGESLAAKILDGPLSVDEATRIVDQLIDGLEAAHESGVVHRDLKPANVQITPDGNVKILDFGLAKVETKEAEATDLSLSPTMTRDATQAGIILGTAPYMSPEQARGLPVDKRSDIFSFGCVVFEMLTGQKAFGGDLVSDVMAAVIKSDPDWSLLPSPAEHCKPLLKACLEKEPKRRLRDIGDARLELARAIRPPSVDAAPSRVTVGHAIPMLDHVATSPTGAFRFAPTYGRFAVSKKGTLAYVPMEPETSQASLVFVEPDVDARWRVTEVDSPPVMGQVRISPDGSRLAFQGTYGERDVWAHDFERGTLTRLSSAPGEDETPVWSPDGRFIMYAAMSRDENGINRVPADGGTGGRGRDARDTYDAQWQPFSHLRLVARRQMVTF